MDRRGRSVLEGGLMTAREVVELMKKSPNGTWSAQSYRDTFKAGNPDTPGQRDRRHHDGHVRCAQTRRRGGPQFVITHEDTYWNDRDDTKDLAGNALLKLKNEFIEKNDMVIFRDHDHMHSMKPDFTVLGTLAFDGDRRGRRGGHALSGLHDSRDHLRGIRLPGETSDGFPRQPLRRRSECQGQPDSVWPRICHARVSRRTPTS